MTTRRDFLKYALLSGAAGATEALPAAIRRAFAIAPNPGTSWRDAEHVVILMQENRSFDHMFGTLQGVRGFNDPRAMRLANGNPVMAQSGTSGSGTSGQTWLPWRLNIRDTRITWMGSIPHSRDSQVDAWNDGGHDRWIDAKTSPYEHYARYPLTMGYYTREDLPFYYALADAFTICDQHYCGAMTSTTPNRLLFWTGTLRDLQAADSRVYMRNEEIMEGGLTWTTFPERLEKAGISWKFYQNELTQTGGMTGRERAWLSNFGSNVLECFDRYCVSANPGFGAWIDARMGDYTAHIDGLMKQDPSAARDEQLAATRTLLDILIRRRAAAGRTPDMLQPEERALFEKAFVTNSGDPDYRALETLAFPNGDRTLHMDAPRGDILHRFRQDVRTGTLPAVSWLAAPEHFSDHPTSPWYGAWYVSEIMDILTENPDVWKKTIFLITYDENDGYFDHCCSYAAPDPYRPETGRSSASIGPDGLEHTSARDERDRGVPARMARGGPIGLGFRVPLIVASPWSRGGWVNSELCEHTSTLQFLEAFAREKFGKTITETNISPWRRAISGDLTSCFRPYDGTVPSLPHLDRDTHLHAIEAARDQPLPGGFHALGAAELAALRADPATLRATVRQEPGTRPSCALPYEPYCDGGLTPDGEQLALRLRAGRALHGARAAGLPFNIYCHGMVPDPPRRQTTMQAGTYAVAAGDTLDTAFDLAHFAGRLYEVTVHAPNGFYRRFRGRQGGLRLQAECRYLHAPGKDLVLRVTNTTPRTVTVACALANQRTRQTLRLPPGRAAEAAFNLAADAMWYDLTLTSPAEPELAYQFAGRVETGRPGITDPTMGI
ncbi:phosphocholine-specific phospholipase C [Gluconacetobacter takamatsuzukensis]|uniref:phospholipase C n=1 Tax=Gluconacetobacter takamatsuzukensis TaxID=1286190 RepID=A0A7W4KES7_9PROT|nr:phospholipase C, phosphocholine-specific [Gluconacetobacter takamatsuzukensis]MBB2205574.1 phospholipase C, phosphocholine-specific [Gluconacetobacter takamatsuzukensis]